MWDSDAEDWVSQTANSIVKKLQNELKPGTIILLHEKLYSVPAMHKNTVSNVGNIVKALDLFLEKNKSQYKFLTVPELLRTGKERKILWLRKAPVGWLEQLKCCDD